MRTDLSAAIGPEAPTLAFDGDCGFCQATVSRLQRRARPRMRATPWHSLPDHITRPHRERLDREVLVLRGARVADSGAQALGSYLASSPRFRYRATGLLLRAPVIRQAARLVYRQVATHRHRMPGGTATCALPRTHD
ncbi:thiol-disulfide oxidoreductase DCC family protein [Streptomyces sp. NPDC088358]|uniref:thiol-disulfide oxidoreductase DCC family protein n=1 Tax=Streptomyces sp. NPDC088358 TaxID=3365857 RepID=UPI0038150668